MPVMTEIAKNRKVLSIPWLEGDESLWHYQPRAVNLANQVRKAREDNLTGVVCIHWRTEETKLNFKMFTAEANDTKELIPVRKRFKEIITAEYGFKAADIICEEFLTLTQHNYSDNYSHLNMHLMNHTGARLMLN